MAALNSWIHAFRLRTLPLALSCIGMGSVLALYHGTHKMGVSLLALSTATLLQLLSNLANDYGDAVNGADLAGRVGPERMVASGKISRESMKVAMYVLGGLSLASGVALLYVGLAGADWSSWLGFLALGLVSIAAAITYTAGDKPYGYAGLGDLSVLLFFGFTAVLGSYYLHAGSIQLALLAPAVGMGGLAVAVLNLNNMRDLDSDLRAGKRTLAVRLGAQGARRYHAVLVLVSLAALLLYALYHGYKGLFFASAFGSLMQLQTLLAVLRVKEAADYDPFLKQTALRTALIVLLAIVFYPFS